MILGIDFDPLDTSANPTVYCTSNKMFHKESNSTGGLAINGKLHAVSGSNLDTVVDVVFMEQQDKKNNQPIGTNEKTAMAPTTTYHIASRKMQQQELAAPYDKRNPWTAWLRAQAGAVVNDPNGIAITHVVLLR